MIYNKHHVKVANLNDQNKWFDFVKSVEPDFCGMDLINNVNYRSGMIKNMDRGTALYIEDGFKFNSPIIGALSYSPNQNHISWLAVHPDYRRSGIASLLLTRALENLSKKRAVTVKTFLYDDAYGTAARRFYESHGFIAKDIIKEAEGFPHPVQEFLRPIVK